MPADEQFVGAVAKDERSGEEKRLQTARCTPTMSSAPPRLKRCPLFPYLVHSQQTDAHEHHRNPAADRNIQDQ